VEYVPLGKRTKKNFKLAFARCQSNFAPGDEAPHTRRIESFHLPRQSSRGALKFFAKLSFKKAEKNYFPA
jgi:hypothetical protein